MSAYSGAGLRALSAVGTIGIWIGVACGPAQAQQNDAPSPGGTSSAPPTTNAEGAVGPPPATPAEKPQAAGTVLPTIEVAPPRPAVEAQRRRTASARPSSGRTSSTAAATPAGGGASATAQTTAGRNASLDEARTRIFDPASSSQYVLDRSAIENRPQGSNAPLDKVLLQAPGVTQDSTASGAIHVRNEHGNLQYRINGVMLPEGVGAFGQVLDTSIVGRLELLTGPLPAQYGLRTAGVIDIQTRSDAFNNTGKVGLYGGGVNSITPSIEYGGTAGATQYFLTGRYLGSDRGLDPPTPAFTPIHDRTDQGRGFAYVSHVIDDSSRLVFLGGTATNAFQIPNNPGQPTGTTDSGVPFVNYPFNSANLNERQYETTQFGVLAWQRSKDGLDTQVAAFTRYTGLNFVPDIAGDLAFNGVASQVQRRSLASGIQADNAYRLGDGHTLRFGGQVTAERSFVGNSLTLIPVDDNGDPSGAPPFPSIDNSALLGWVASAYLSDEWKITRQLTLTVGLRFDQMWSYTNANQFSPRVNLAWTPVEGITIHAGYARNFTPPSQVLAAPINLSLVTGTLSQPAVPVADAVRPERSNVFEVGVTQKLLPGLEIGADVYYKVAQDLLDDGQFGAAYVLTAFNYAKGINTGVELTAKYTNENFRAYANVALARQQGTQIVSNQYLFDPDELAYIATHYIYTDHSQIWTGSAGASYLWNGTRFSADLIFGSGLRSGFANTSALPAYTQVNVGLSREFVAHSGAKPFTMRFDIVNLFDHVYEIRDGSGIGVFAPQYGPRRTFYAGVSQKF